MAAEQQSADGRAARAGSLVICCDDASPERPVASSEAVKFQYRKGSHHLGGQKPGLGDDVLDASSTHAPATSRTREHCPGRDRPSGAADQPRERRIGPAGQPAGRSDPPERGQHVIGIGDQLGEPISQQQMTPDRHRRRHRAGDSHHQPAQLLSRGRSAQRPRPPTGLDHHRPGTERGDQPIPHQKPMPRRRCPRRILTDHRSLLRYRIEQRTVRLRIRTVNPARQHGHRRRVARPSNHNRRLRRSTGPPAHPGAPRVSIPNAAPEITVTPRDANSWDISPATRCP